MKDAIPKFRDDSQVSKTDTTIIYNLVRNSLTHFILISSLLQTYVNQEIYEGKNCINFDMKMDNE